MRIDLKQLTLQIVAVFAIFAAALFVPAGTFAWFAGWAFLLLFLAFVLFFFAWLYRHNAGLLHERMRLGAPDQQGWDKLLFPLINILLLGWMVFISLDANRFHWSPVPTWLQAAGALTLICSFELLYLTFRENSFLSPTVRVQTDRGQTVISTGLYQYVRHPMYSAIVVFVIGASLLLGSEYGVLVALIEMILLARRAVLEERTLLRELPGYGTYRAHVKYRLIPYVW